MTTQQSSELPLTGVRVLDMTWFVAGPTATRVLAALGAEVIRVERSDSWQGFRGGDTGPNDGGMYNNLNVDKLAVKLNARHPKGFELLVELIQRSDILIENYSSRVLESWGLSYEEIRSIKPGIIYVSITGFGHSGRNRDYVAFGPTSQALSGMTFLSGLPEEAPAGWGFSYMDHTAGYLAVMAILNALLFKKKTGQGQWVDMSTVEAAITQTGPFVLDYVVNGRPARRPGVPAGNHALHPKTAPHSAYRCAGKDALEQDEWCTIACSTEAEWQALCRVMGQPELATDSRFATMQARIANEDALDALIQEWTQQLGKYDVMYRLQEEGVPAGAVQNAADRVERDPQLRARSLFQQVDHAVLGRNEVEAVPIKFSRTPCKLEMGSPLWGEHNQQILGGILGHSQEELEQWEAEGVI